MNFKADPSNNIGESSAKLSRGSQSCMFRFLKSLFGENNNATASENVSFDTARAQIEIMNAADDRW